MRTNVNPAELVERLLAALDGGNHDEAADALEQLEAWAHAALEPDRTDGPEPVAA